MLFNVIVIKGNLFSDFFEWYALHRLYILCGIYWHLWRFWMSENSSEYNILVQCTKFPNLNSTQLVNSSHNWKSKPINQKLVLFEWNWFKTLINEFSISFHKQSRLNNSIMSKLIEKVSIHIFSSQKQQHSFIHYFDPKSCKLERLCDE